MAFDTYLDIKGVEGEATATGFEKKIEIYSFSWGASNPTTVGSGSTGLSAGRVSVSGFNLMKKTEKASATLFLACCSGTHFPEATVTMRKATGEQKPFLVYKFTDVMVESIQWSGSTGGDDHGSLETDVLEGLEPQDIERRVESLRGVDDPPPLEQQPAHDTASGLPPRSR